MPRLLQAFVWVLAARTVAGTLLAIGHLGDVPYTMTLAAAVATPKGLLNWPSRMAGGVKSYALDPANTERLVGQTFDLA
jgi:hypothetical protein